MWYSEYWGECIFLNYGFLQLYAKSRVAGYSIIIIIIGTSLIYLNSKLFWGSSFFQMHLWILGSKWNPADESSGSLAAEMRGGLALSFWTFLYLPLVAKAADVQSLITETMENLRSQEL